MSPLQVARLLLPLFISIAFSEPIEPRHEGLYQPFTLITAHSASPVHLLSINANNLNFWIGKPTSYICLAQDITIVQCPQGNITAFTWAGYAAGLIRNLRSSTRNNIANRFTERQCSSRTGCLRLPQRRFRLFVRARELVLRRSYWRPVQQVVQ